jgi:hypothetical protein
MGRRLTKHFSFFLLILFSSITHVKKQEETHTHTQQHTQTDPGQTVGRERVNIWGKNFFGITLIVVGEFFLFICSFLFLLLFPPCFGF